MNVVKESTGDLTALLKVQVSSKDYEPKVESVVKDIGKKAHIKGFRKGKVPSGVIRNMYGNDILADELNKIVQSEVNKYLTDNKIAILGQPIPKTDEQPQLDIKANKDYEFSFELGLTPEFEIKLLSNKTKFNKNVIGLDDKLMNEEIERIRKQYGEVSHPDDIQDKDVIQLELQELDSNSLPKEEGLKKDTPVAMDMFTTKWQKEVLKQKKGSTINIPIYKAFDRDKEDIAKQILGIHEDDIKKYSADFAMTIKEVSRSAKCEVNQELFDKVYGKDAVKSLDEFKSKLKEDLKKYYDVQSERVLNTEIVNKLIEETKIALPDEFLNKWIKLTNKEKISDEDLERDYKDFSKSLKWMLITNKVSKDNEIKVEHEEVLGQIRKSIAEQFGMGVQGIEDERMNEIVNQFAQNEEHYRKSHDTLLDEKLFNHMQSVFTIKEKEVSLDKFKDIAKNVHKKPKSRFKLF